MLINRETILTLARHSLKPKVRLVQVLSVVCALARLGPITFQFFRLASENELHWSEKLIDVILIA
jgi:hypothetical protein